MERIGLFGIYTATTFADEETFNIGGSIRYWWDSHTSSEPPPNPVYPFIGQVGGCQYVIFCS